jgi:type 1 glutamine amidotransferase
MKRHTPRTKQKTQNPEIRILVLALAACFLFLALPFSSVAGQSSSPPIKALVVTGQNNHNWKTSSAVFKQILDETGLFQVEIVASPPAGSDMKSFRPDFLSFKVVILDYNGDPWPPATQKAFVAYVKNGGGVVVYHAADNAFPSWPEYNEIIGLGG